MHFIANDLILSVSCAGTEAVGRVYETSLKSNSFSDTNWSEEFSTSIFTYPLSLKSVSSDCDVNFTYASILTSSPPAPC